jgi:hypothetical protein
MVPHESFAGARIAATLPPRRTAMRGKVCEYLNPGLLGPSAEDVSNKKKRGAVKIQEADATVTLIG